MKITRLMLAVSTVVVIGLVPWATAQMMAGNHDHASMNNADSTSQPGMMANMGEMMGDMSKRCTMMSTSFVDLENHVETMMQMDDISALKIEMQKHLSMMQKMHEGMMQQKSVCQNMMSMMGSGGMGSSGMHDMMGMGTQADSSSGEHSHNH